MDYCWKGIRFKPPTEYYCLMKGAKPFKDIDDKIKCYEDSCPGALDAGPYCIKKESNFQLPNGWSRDGAKIQMKNENRRKKINIVCHGAIAANQKNQYNIGETPIQQA